VFVGCQSAPPETPAGYNCTTKDGLMTARPLSDAEMVKAMKSAQRASDMAPVILAANTFGGLDPTGMTQMAVTAETTRRMQDFQQYVPGMMAANVKRLEAYCKTNPKFETVLSSKKPRPK
jgi:hypothetical protein